MGFEPTTFSLARRRSTTEPRPQVRSYGAESAESQNRTDDTAIFSRVLYQLSYLGRICFVEACRILLDALGIVKQAAREPSVVSPRRQARVGTFAEYSWRRRSLEQLAGWILR